MNTVISALEMRKRLGGILDQVYKKGDHVTITRGNTPLVTLIPAREHEELMTRRNRLKSVGMALKKIENWQGQNAKRISDLENTTEAIRKMRDSR